MRVSSTFATICLLIGQSSAFRLQNSRHLPVVSAQPFSRGSLPNPLTNRLGNSPDIQTKLFVQSVDKSTEKKRSNLFLRVTTGLTLGAVGSVFLHSSKTVFAAGMCLLTLIAQSEYHNILNGIDVQATKEIGVLAAVLFAALAAHKPRLHSLALPILGSALMSKLILFNTRLPTIKEVSAELFGLYYLFYLPSFWILLKFLPPAVMGKVCRPEMFDNLDRGFLLTFFSLATIAFSDIGAYFVGRSFGRHKLATLSKSAGEASPNKTVEGAVSGILSGCAVSLLGAYVMNWPLWRATGLLFGLMLGVVGIVGDLTASMLKRDAKIKDSGNLLPGHGGVLDRVDSYLLTAPLAYAFCRHVLPPLVKDANW